jgi:hypothetical protein
MAFVSRLTARMTLEMLKPYFWRVISHEGVYILAQQSNVESSFVNPVYSSFARLFLLPCKIPRPARACKLLLPLQPP